MTTTALSRDDLALCRMIAELIAMNTMSTTDELLVDLDAKQDDDGFTFDHLRGGGRTNWYRYNGYHAENWDAVKAEALRLASDRRFLEAL